jgi:hypothetical protein
MNLQEQKVPPNPIDETRRESRPLVRPPHVADPRDGGHRISANDSDPPFGVFLDGEPFVEARDEIPPHGHLTQMRKGVLEDAVSDITFEDPAPRCAPIPADPPRPADRA